MSSARLAARTPWPTNLGAYSRTAVTAPSVVTLGALMSTSATPEAVASFILALAASVAGLLTSERWRAAISWLATVLAVIPLALARYEGEQAISLGTLVQLDARDAGAIAVMVMTSVLVTFVPNALPRFAEHAYDDGSTAGDVVPAPVLAVDDDDIPAEGVTSVHAAITAEQLAAYEASRATAVSAAPPVPAQAAAPEAERGLLAGILGRRNGAHEA